MHAKVMSLLIAAAFCASLPANAFDFSKLDLNKVGSLVKNVGEATREIGEPEEIRIGAELASTLLGAAPLKNDASEQRYVNLVGRYLAAQTERPDLPWRFGVIDNANINAFAAPGGYVFVTSGLMQQIKSEAELAGVLAHEIAHVLKKHHLKAVQKAAGTGALADVASLAAKDDQRDKLDKIFNVGRELYMRGLDKDDEFEADRMGVVIAARAGYDPFGLPAVMQTLETLNPKDGSLSLLFKTHPLPGARIEALEKVMGTKFDQYADQPALQSRFKKMS